MRKSSITQGWPFVGEHQCLCRNCDFNEILGLAFTRSHTHARFTSSVHCVEFVGLGKKEIPAGIYSEQP